MIVSVKAIFLLSIVALVLACLYRLYLAAADPLRSVPGPLLARFTRLWYTGALSKGNFEKTNIELHRKYGPVVRVGPNLFSIDDAEAAATIYSTTKIFPKSKWYDASDKPGKSNIFSTTNNDEGAEFRRKYQPAFTGFLTYESAVDDCGKLLHQRLKESVAAGIPIDLGWWMTCFAYDVNGLITFSKRFGFLEAGEDIETVAASLSQRLRYQAHVGVYPEIHPYTFALVNLLMTAGGKVDYSFNFTAQQTEKRKGRTMKTAGQTDMLTQYLNTHAQQPEWFTYDDLLMGGYISIVAGADTTRITLNAILYYLIKNPKILDRLRSEIDNMSSEGVISDPVKYQETQRMPYLQAVIKEGQRMHPAAGLPMWRVVPRTGVTISGRFFPPGTTVGVNSWVAHRSSIFSPDPDTFRPERWLEGDAGMLASMNRYYMPFGRGPRVCIGKNIALMEMTKVIAQLVRAFDFELDESFEWQTVNNWLVEQNGVRCRLRLRDTRKA